MNFDFYCTYKVERFVCFSRAVFPSKKETNGVEMETGVRWNSL